MKSDSDHIAAYLAGDLSPSGMAAFEQEMETNPALRMEVESLRGMMGEVRGWMLADAPGSERVADLIPPIHLTPKSPLPQGEGTFCSPFSSWEKGVGGMRLGTAGVWSSGYRYVLQALAACLIFFLGYALGTSTTSLPTIEELAPPPQLVTHAPQATPAPVVVPAVMEIPTPPPPKAEPVHQPVRTQAVDEGGRLVIETTLTGSTSRAVWVVDGNFRLEQPGT